MDLSASTGALEGEINLTWTAPGDEGNTGTVTGYLVKYSTSPINNQTDFDNATTYSQSWSPLSYGNTENETIVMPLKGMTYYIAIEGFDEVNNYSPSFNTAGNSAVSRIDDMAPSNITNLVVITGALKSQLNLNWTSVGDNGNSGTATSYIVRYSTAPILNQNDFNNASIYVQSWTPLATGNAESKVISGLQSGVLYYVAIEAKDEAGNQAGLSNTANANATTQIDVAPPAAIINLAATTGLQHTQINLTWTATGDDQDVGTASRYIVRYSTSAISNQTDFNNANTYVQSWVPLSAGNVETKTLTGLTPGVTYYIAIETIDEKPNQAIDFNKTGNSAMARLDVTKPSAITNR